MKNLVLILTIGLLISCGKKIEVTNEYIFNEYWDEYNNAVEIQKMKVIDSSLNIFDKDFRTEPNHWNIANKVEIDSTFYCSYYGLTVTEKDIDLIRDFTKKDEKIKQVLEERGINIDSILNKTTKKRTLLSGKIYFTQDNGWNWNVNGVEKPIIGKLKNNTWYKFSNLTFGTFHQYIFIDSIGKTHTFSVNLDNY